MKEFILRTATRDDKVIVAAGLCENDLDTEMIANVIRQYTFGETKDAFLIDHKLMRMLEEALAGRSVFAAGATIRLPDVAINCGGVIGTLGKYEVIEDETQAVKLDDMYSMIVQPGSFGLVCEQRDAAEFMRVLCENTGTGAHDIYRLLRQKQLTPSLFISDGCGPGACGFAAICVQGNSVVYNL